MSELNVLHVWDGLELARRKEHPYGGDMLEVFAQHFVPEKTAEDQWIQAGHRLYIILSKYCQCNNVTMFIDGRKIGDWMCSYKFFHKCDIRVVTNESMQSAGIGSEEAISEDSERYNLFGATEITQDSKSSESTLSVLRPEQSEQLLGELEACKIETPKRSIAKRLPVLLKNLWASMLSRRNRKAVG